jgi:hypothetical protein
MKNIIAKTFLTPLEAALPKAQSRPLRDGLLLTGLVLILPLLLCFVYASVYAYNQEASTTSAEEFVIQETISDTIEPVAGGETELITNTGATASVFLPSEAIIASAEVSVSSVLEADIVSSSPVPANLNVVADLVYNFTAISDGVTLTTFEQPVVLTFLYTDAQIAGLSESGLRVYYWDTAQEEWIICSDYTLDATNNTITATVNHFTLFAVMASSFVCGNGVVEYGEQCDTANLNGQTCVGLGYTSGTLTCNSNCLFNTSNCASGGGGGGGGGGYYVPSVKTKVIIEGKAYPNSQVTILKDGKVAHTITADAYANFKKELASLTPGIYTFGVWGEDKSGRKSITFSFTTSVIRAVTTTISDIFLPPTIELEKTRVSKGEILNILGSTVPKSEVNLNIESENKIIKKTAADDKGEWNYGFDTCILNEGAHIVRAKAISPEGLTGTYSNTLAFLVGSEATTVLIKNGDISADEKINLIDFSILLYNWGVPKNSAADLNNDNKVNLTDFSIMLYHWTG